MKRIFRLFQRSVISKTDEQHNNLQPQDALEDVSAEKTAEPSAEEKDPGEGDSFTVWCRSRTRGGIERVERNDIYEEYSEYGTDGDGRLVYRYYHRYPEHERSFDLSDERTLNFDAFNSRLLSELDRGAVSLEDYNACITKAGQSDDNPKGFFTGFDETQTAVLRRFCEGIDTLRDKTFRSSDGIFRCEGVSVVGEETLDILFRKPLQHDALYQKVSGVTRSEADAYGIDDLWIMSVVNRLRERCASCRVETLRSDWSLKGETVCLIICESFEGIGGDLIAAVAPIESLTRFGFYSLDFSNK